MGNYQRANDFLLKNIHIVYFIIGFILLVPVTFLIYGMINPQPIVVKDLHYKISYLKVYVDLFVMPWIALFFISLINGVYLIIFCVIFSPRNNRQDLSQITKSVKACKAFIGVTTALILLFFIGIIALNYLMQYLPPGTIFVIWALAVVSLFTGRWISKKWNLEHRTDMLLLIVPLAVAGLAMLSSIFVIKY